MIDINYNKIRQLQSLNEEAFATAFYSRQVSQLANSLVEYYVYHKERGK